MKNRNTRNFILFYSALFILALCITLLLVQFGSHSLFMNILFVYAILIITAIVFFLFDIYRVKEYRNKFVKVYFETHDLEQTTKAMEAVPRFITNPFSKMQIEISKLDWLFLSEQYEEAKWILDQMDYTRSKYLKAFHDISFLNYLIYTEQIEEANAWSKAHEEAFQRYLRVFDLKPLMLEVLIRYSLLLKEYGNAQMYLSEFEQLLQKKLKFRYYEEETMKEELALYHIEAHIGTNALDTAKEMLDQIKKELLFPIDQTRFQRIEKMLEANKKKNEEVVVEEEKPKRKRRVKAAATEEPSAEEEKPKRKRKPKAEVETDKETQAEPVKRKRGRPRKVVEETSKETTSAKPKKSKEKTNANEGEPVVKRKRGRPRKSETVQKTEDLGKEE